jgi:glycosyltransferase involved in cell wall biosynthesis
MQTKKKILVMIDWFVPGYKAGGPIRSCVNLVLSLKNEFDIYVLTTDTDHGESVPYLDILSNEWITATLDPAIHVFYAKKKTLTLKQLKEQIDLIAADFIYLNHLFSPYFVIYPLWLKYNNKITGKIIVCPRGALYDSALHVKPHKKRPFLFLFKWMGMHKQIRFHATNERERTAIERYFPGSSILVADNLPDQNQPAFASVGKIPGSLTCVFISRIVPIKNILFFLNVLEQVNATVRFTIVGPVEDENYWNECKKKITELPAAVKVDYIGAKKHEALTAIIQQHHLYVLPTTGENFGHAIFEALSAGRVVLISDQTPWLNLAGHNAGWDVSLNDKDSFVSVVEKVAAWGQEEFDRNSLAAWQYADNIIKATGIKEKYLELFS